MRILVALALASIHTLALAQNVDHPLDPMTWQEYWTVLEALDAADHITDETVIPVVLLQNPPKDEVFAWLDGGPLHRRASPSCARDPIPTRPSTASTARITRSTWTRSFRGDDGRPLLKPPSDDPTLSQPGEGLPAYTAGNRSLGNEDIIRPFDFFDRKPAMDPPE